MAEYDKRFAFRVEIDGITKAAFRTAGPLESTTEQTEEHEGGQDEPTKEPGKTSYANVVLTWGKTDNTELHDWWKAVNQDHNEDKRNVSVVQLNRDGSEKRRVNLIGAWPCRFKWAEYDATASENVIRECELCVDRIEND